MSRPTSKRRAASAEGCDSGWERETRLQGGTAYLTVVSLLCGFAFAALVLYLGLAKRETVHVVSACLLAGAFVGLLYSVFAFASEVHTAAAGRYSASEHYGRESLWSMLAGLVLLLSSLCVMSFGWSAALGWTAVGLSACFVMRFAWASVREMTLWK
jgi:hypothetical protein